MKLKNHLIWTIGLLLLITVCIATLLFFSGIIDDINTDRALKNTADSMYDALNTNNWSNFNIDRSFSKRLKLKVVIYQNDGSILYTNLPLSENETVINTQTIESLHQKYLKNSRITMWSLKEMEKEFSHILEDYDGYGKYDIKIMTFIRSGNMLFIRPVTRLMITLIISVTLGAGIICSIIIILNFGRVIRLINKVSTDYGNGNYSRDIPLQGTAEERSIIKVLNKMGRHIRMSEKQRANLIMGLSHDFKTPLTLIRGHAEFILSQNKDSNAAISKSAQIITSKVDQLSSMVTELTEFVSLEQGDYPLKKEETDFARWINDYVKQCEGYATVYKKTIISDIKIPEQSLLLMDCKLMERLMDNIVHNALRYTGDNGTIKISAWINDKKRICFSIEDNGKGIEKKDRPFVFDMFYRASPSRKTPGMGIGLSVVKDIADAHGWVIKLTDAKPSGCIFTVTT